MSSGIVQSTHAVQSTSGQAVTDELRRWIVAQAEAGCTPETVLQAMRASGWAEDVAVEALESTLTERLQQLGLPVPQVPAPVPEPDLADMKLSLRALDRDVRVLAELKLPRVVVFGGLLSHDECDALVVLARQRLQRSETVDNTTGGSEVNAARTSDGMFFERGETELIDRIERRIAPRVVMLSGCATSASAPTPTSPHASAFDTGGTTRSVLLRALIWAMSCTSSRCPGMCPAPKSAA